MPATRRSRTLAAGPHPQHRRQDTIGPREGCPPLSCTDPTPACDSGSLSGQTCHKACRLHVDPQAVIPVRAVAFAGQPRPRSPRMTAGLKPDRQRDTDAEIANRDRRQRRARPSGRRTASSALSLHRPEIQRGDERRYLAGCRSASTVLTTTPSASGQTRNAIMTDGSFNQRFEYSTHRACASFSLSRWRRASSWRVTNDVGSEAIPVTTSFPSNRTACPSLILPRVGNRACRSRPNSVHRQKRAPRIFSRRCAKPESGVGFHDRKVPDAHVELARIRQNVGRNRAADQPAGSESIRNNSAGPSKTTTAPLSKTTCATPRFSCNRPGATREPRVKPSPNSTSTPAAIVAMAFSANSARRGFRRIGGIHAAEKLGVAKSKSVNRG